MFIRKWKETARTAIEGIAPQYPIKSVSFLCASSSCKSLMECLTVIVAELDDDDTIMDCSAFKNDLADALMCEVSVELYPYELEGYGGGKESILYEREGIRDGHPSRVKEDVS